MSPAAPAWGGSSPSSHRVIGDVDVVLTTTRAVRKRLRFEAPVDRDVVMECIELALQAPTGGGQQDWAYVCIDDPAAIAELAAIYRRTFAARHGAGRPAATPASLSGGVAESAWFLAENFHRVPLVVIPCRTSPAPTSRSDQAGFWASILPSAWSFMLAARSRGLVTVYTVRAVSDAERDVAEIVGIDPDRVAMAGMIVVGHPDRLEFRAARRRAAAEVVRWIGSARR